MLKENVSNMYDDGTNSNKEQEQGEVIVSAVR